MQSPLGDRVPVRRIVVFAAWVFGIWLGLVVAWPLVRPLYLPAYCGIANVLFEGGAASAELTPAQEVQGSHDVDIRMEKTGSGVWGEMRHSAKIAGYFPTVSLLALVLATPIPWRRKRKALLLGLILVTAFVLLRAWIPIRRDFSNPDPLQVFEPGVFGRWLLGIGERALVNAPASWFVVPIFIWVGVAFRRSDWELLDRSEPSEGGS